MDLLSARLILAWHYEPPYDLYNAAEQRDGVGLAGLLDPANAYRVAFSGDALAGFCCFGPDARVAEGDCRSEALDLGAGTRPDLIGHGAGAIFLGEVIAVADTLALGAPLRATVAAFNLRARRACARVGRREHGPKN